jgi:hypothetical protein
MFLLTLLLSITLFFGNYASKCQCGFDCPEDDCEPMVLMKNIAPVCKNTGGIFIGKATHLLLNASDCYDPDNGPKPLSFHWNIFMGPVAEPSYYVLLGCGTETPELTKRDLGVLEEGLYNIMLYVSDGVDTISIRRMYEVSYSVKK